MGLTDDLLDTELQGSFLQELRAKIAERHEISREVRKQLDRMIVDLDNEILSAKQHRSSAYPAFLRRRTDLEMAVLRCQQQIMAEDVASWRDIAQLEAEVRELRRELAALGHDEV